MMFWMSCLQILNAAYQVEITVRSSSTIIHMFLQRMKQVRPGHVARSCGRVKSLSGGHLFFVLQAVMLKLDGKYVHC